MSATSIGRLTFTRAYNQRIPGKGTVKFKDQQQFCYTSQEGPISENCGCGGGTPKNVMYFDVILPREFLNTFTVYPALRDATDELVIRIRSTDDLLVSGGLALKPGFLGQDHDEARSMQGDTQLVNEFGVSTRSGANDAWLASRFGKLRM